MTDDIITLAEAARRLGRSPNTLAEQRRRGRIEAFKIGRDWLVRVDEVERYRTENLGQLGRPLGAKDVEPRKPRTGHRPWSEVKRSRQVLGDDERTDVRQEIVPPTRPPGQ